MRNITILFICSCILLSVPMLSFGEKYKTIRVEFFEKGQKKPFAVSDVPIIQLPETFKIDTALDIGNQKWSIVSAEPVKKSQFEQTGKLRVIVSKIETIAPQELLYSLPTISHDIADVVETDSLEGTLIVHEDDWRQIEFVSRAYTEEINEEIRSIEAIYNDIVQGVGFKKMHMRENIVTPLKDTKLTRDVLANYFEIETEFNEVAFSRIHGIIRNGFAVRIQHGWILWGQSTENGTIVYLNLRPQNRETVSNHISKAMETFLDEYQLHLVDWTRMAVIGQGKLTFEEYAK